MKTITSRNAKNAPGGEAAAYESWLLAKVSETLDRIASGKTGLHEHSDAMALMKRRLKPRLHKTSLRQAADESQPVAPIII